MTTAVETHPSTLTAPALTGLQHIGLTVRDIVASEAWYTNVLGLVRAFVEPHATGEGYAVVMTHPSTGLFVGLDHHPDADREMFSPLRTAGQPHLPLRAGSRPRTSTELPHCQLDQQPEDSRHVDAILAEASRWPSVLAGPSAISVEGARALMLDAGTAAGPKEAFMVGQEFCHVHAQGDFSLHAALPLPLAAAAEHSGWAEPHFLAHTGQAPATIVMLYAPRDRAEQDVVLGLVRASYEYALNQQPAV
ncbi:MAG: VOC family protein [Acidimicrobiales bacterium]